MANFAVGSTWCSIVSPAGLYDVRNGQGPKRVENSVFRDIRVASCSRRNQLCVICSRQRAAVRVTLCHARTIYSDWNYGQVPSLHVFIVTL